jgi:hypothetical protein
MVCPVCLIPLLGGAGAIAAVNQSKDDDDYTAPNPSLRKQWFILAGLILALTAILYVYLRMRPCSKCPK